jgi:hypothetical protein
MNVRTFEMLAMIEVDEVNVLKNDSTLEMESETAARVV